MERGNPVIVCSAIKIPTNTQDIVLVGARHWDILMRNQFTQTVKIGMDVYRNQEEQGFIDQFGKFYNRKDALILARNNNQIKFELDFNTDKLYSEMLY